MWVMIWQLLGALIFVMGTFILGQKLRNKPNQSMAEFCSRISHFLYWGGLVIPGAVGLFYPGFSNYDQILGINSIPFKSISFIMGLFLIFIGLYYTFASNKLLLKLGKGTAAFKLTKHIVEGGVYKQVRNPMSLGYYLLIIGIGLLFGSTSVALGALLIIIPAHIFNLKYFEELELELRYGKSYADYRKSVPFLVPRVFRS